MITKITRIDPVSKYNGNKEKFNNRMTLEQSKLLNKVDTIDIIQEISNQKPTYTNNMLLKFTIPKGGTLDIKI